MKVSELEAKSIDLKQNQWSRCYDNGKDEADEVLEFRMMKNLKKLDKTIAFQHGLMQKLGFC